MGLLIYFEAGYEFHTRDITLFSFRDIVHKKKGEIDEIGLSKVSFQVFEFLTVQNERLQQRR